MTRHEVAGGGADEPGEGRVEFKRACKNVRAGLVVNARYLL